MEADTQKTDKDPTARKARIDAIWEQLNANNSRVSIKHVCKNTTAEGDKMKSRKHTPEWMVSLGLVGKRSKTVATADAETETYKKREHGGGIKIAAAALAAVREAPVAKKEGKIEVNEVRDFAGEEVTITKYVDPSSKEAAQALKREEMMASSSSGLDRLLQQIEKKPKLNVLDKSKKDWGDYKEEKGLEEELEAYKRSGDKYLDRVAFLQRADLREYEKERDARLAFQAKKLTDTE